MKILRLNRAPKIVHRSRCSFSFVSIVTSLPYYQVKLQRRFQVKRRRTSSLTVTSLGLDVQETFQLASSTRVSFIYLFFSTLKRFSTRLADTRRNRCSGKGGHREKSRGKAQSSQQKVFDRRRRILGPMIRRKRRLITIIMFRGATAELLEKKKKKKKEREATPRRVNRLVSIFQIEI